MRGRRRQVLNAGTLPIRLAWLASRPYQRRHPAQLDALAESLFNRSAPLKRDVTLDRCRRSLVFAILGAGQAHGHLGPAESLMHGQVVRSVGQQQQHSSMDWQQAVQQARVVAA